MATSAPWRESWAIDDPERVCYTCGGAPTGRFRDGSPKYGHDHPPIYPDGPIATLKRVVRLSPPMVKLAEQEGRARAKRHTTHRRRDRFVPDDREQNDIQAVGGEIAVSKLLDLPWTGGESPDQSDVGPFGVRRSRLDCMPIRQHDKDDQPMIFVTGVLPVFTVHGWITAREARRRNDWFVDQPPSYWCVPIADLRPLSSLPAVISDDVPDGV